MPEISPIPIAELAPMPPSDMSGVLPQQIATGEVPLFTTFEDSLASQILGIQEESNGESKKTDNNEAAGIGFIAISETISLESGSIPAIEQEHSLKLLGEIYEGLRSAEQREALPDDAISVRLKPDSVEYHHLLESGISPERLERGNFVRKELLDAGFSFINTLGNGEKGIISGPFKDPETGNEHDFTGSVLLTQSELEMVYRYQQTQPERFSIQNEDIDEVRKDMLSFVMEASSREPYSNSRALAVDVFHDLDYGGLRVGNQEDWKIVEAYLDRQVKKFKKTQNNTNRVSPIWAVQEEFIHSQCADLFTEGDDGGAFLAKQVRGYRTNSLSIREQKLNGQPSPFLESGFYFGSNPDINIFTGDEADIRSRDQLRMNVGTIHLAGAHPRFPGFSEMGGDSADQQYIPTGFYVSNIFPRDDNDRTRVQASETAYLRSVVSADSIVEAQKRLIAVARADTGQNKKRFFRRRLEN